MKLLKNILPIVAIIFSTLFLSSATLLAKSNGSGMTCTGPDEETIQMQKIAFYTSELKLTPKEAEKFWPLYNEYWDARMNAHKEAIKAIRQLNKALADEKVESDSEIKRLSELYLANYSAEADLLSEYFTKFQKILPIRKAAKIFSTEEKFRRMLIKQLRNSSQQKKSNAPATDKK